MAQERGYDQQVGAAQPVGLPQAGPGAFGAGVGDAVAQIGGALHQRELRAYQIERQQTADSEAADFNARFALAREEADKASIDARNKAAPGGAGHAEAINKWWRDRAATLADGITDDRVRRSAEAQLQEFGTRLGAAEYQFQEGARVGKLVTDTQSASDIAANRAYRMHDPKAFAEELSLGRQSIETMPGVPADVREKLVKHHDQTVTVGFMNGIVDTNPKAVMPLLDSGQFDDILSPEQIDRLRSGAQVEIRRDEAEQRAQASLAKADAREKLSTLNARIEAGEDVPDAELVAGGQMATAIGDDSGAYKLGVARIKAGVNKVTRSWTPIQFEGRINDLSAKGEKRSPEEDIELAQLQSIAPTRARQFRADPGGWAASNGAPPPALNLADPASINARLQWSRSASAATGRPVAPLTGAEAEQFAAEASASPKARIEVANQLARFGGRAAVAAARQVAPNDAMLARIVLLRPGDRAAAVTGADARKANPALIDGQAGNDARDAFMQRVGPATQLMGLGDVNAAFEVARNLFADYAVRHGVQAFDDKQWNSFIHRALGGTRDAQGNYHGGIGAWAGTSVLLPSTMSQSQFETTLSRMRWDDKNANAPAFRNGTVMTPEQVRRYLPVQRPDGRYEFHDPANADIVLEAKRGGTWTLDIARLHDRYVK